MIVQKRFQQLIALTMVLILIYPGVLSARNKKQGARIKVTKLDGEVLEGELLKVKEKEIILRGSSENGITIPVNEIKKIEQKKKGKFITGFAAALGVSMIVGGILGSKLKSEGVGFGRGVVGYGALFGLPSGMVFGTITAYIKRRKTYNLENEEPEKILKILKKLKSKSRF